MVDFRTEAEKSPRCVQNILCQKKEVLKEWWGHKKEQRQREEPVCACLVTLLCLTVCNPMDCSPPGSCVHGDSLGKNTGVGSLSLLQGIFPTQGWNPGLPHCRQILYRLSHQGNCLKGLPLVKSRTILTTRIMGLHEYILIQIKPWTFGKKEDI